MAVHFFRGQRYAVLVTWRGMSLPWLYVLFFSGIEKEHTPLPRSLSMLYFLKTGPYSVVQGGLELTLYRLAFNLWHSPCISLLAAGLSCHNMWLWTFSLKCLSSQHWCLWLWESGSDLVSVPCHWQSKVGDHRRRQPPQMIAWDFLTEPLPALIIFDVTVGLENSVYQQ